jgi:hypothetical protein
MEFVTAKMGAIKLKRKDIGISVAVLVLPDCVWISHPKSYFKNEQSPGNFPGLCPII